MPYSNPKQPVAAFLNIKRKQGLSAAKAFGRKHREELESAAKSKMKASGQRPYSGRGSKRSKNAA